MKKNRKKQRKVQIRRAALNINKNNQVVVSDEFDVIIETAFKESVKDTIKKLTDSLYKRPRKYMLISQSVSEIKNSYPVQDQYLPMITKENENK